MDMAKMNTAPRARIVNRVRQQLQAKLSASALEIQNEDEDDEPKIAILDPGWMQLFSYFAPGLKAGPHSIDITQRILAPHDAFLPSDPSLPTEPLIPDPAHYLELISTQEFRVFGPRFSLPEGVIHQTYPPQGHEDHNHVLPHIVFNDPHLPWEQIGSPSEEALGAVGDTLRGAEAGSTAPTTQTRPRGSTPWLALLVFTEDELKLTSADLQPGSLFPSDTPTPLVQSKTTMALTLSLRDILRLHKGKAVTPVRDDPHDPIDPTEQADMIFVPHDLFTSLTCSYNDRGERVLPATRVVDPVLPDQRVPDLSRYKYLAHVRNINTLHMASGGDEEQGLFSVIISHRAGTSPGFQRSTKTPSSKSTPPELTNTEVHLPKSVVVHLVSLLGVEAHISLPLQSERVGLVSLYSWNYACLPPDSVNFVESMRALGRQVDVSLGPPESVLERISPKLVDGKPVAANPVTTRLANRFRDGYSLVRWLPRTGEVSIALMRGPLVPRGKTVMPQFWPAQVNFSEGLQILDPELKVMDIAYSTAWELGRTLAIADRVFAAAIVRVRREVNVYAMRETGKESATKGVWRSGKMVLESLNEAVGMLAGVTNGLQEGEVVVDPAKRWAPVDKSAEITLAAFEDDKKQVAASLLSAHSHSAMEIFASTPSAAADPEDAPLKLLPYNEINIPHSNDWALILKWIVDKLYLYHIPAHYLITDPSHLPPESIRFFYIDDTWLDSLIDGALSIGNNLTHSDDTVRQAMKYQLNRYFATSLDQDHHDHPPQIPKYGFLLRSAVVKAFPGLEVHAPWPNKDDPRLEVLRIELLDQEVMLCLFDRVPGSPEFSQIVIAQPPHQQRFAMGTGFTRGADGINQLSFEFLKMYTEATATAMDTGQLLLLKSFKEGDTKEFVFDWDNNTIILPKFAETCYQVLKDKMEGGFKDEKGPSAAVVGLQLNDGMSRITIKVPLAAPGREEEWSSVRQITLPVPPPTIEALRTQFLTATQQPEQPQGSPAHVHRFLSPALLAGPRPPPIPTPPGLPQTLRPKPATTTMEVNPGGQHASQFQITSFIIGQPKKPLILPIYPATPTAPPNLAIDVVFRFLPAFSQIAGLQISRINIFIPLGTGPGDLVAEYKGPGARMLSNQRFNADVRTESKSLNITLLPRSTTLLVPLRVNPDVSFVLNQVVLNGVEGNVVVSVREVYKQKRPGGSWVGSVGVGQMIVRKRWWGK